jgi:hypothetical protein
MFGEWYQKTNNKVNLFISSVLFVFWYHSPNVLDTPHICNISRLRVKTRLCDRCSGKAMSITHCECLFVALVIQHAMRMRQNSLCGLSGSIIFPPYLLNDTILEKKSIENKMCFSFLCNFCLNGHLLVNEHLLPLSPVLSSMTLLKQIWSGTVSSLKMAQHWRRNM